jgi:tetratricopeptide (TPR) repeat protein
MSSLKKHLNQQSPENHNAELGQFLTLNQDIFAELLTFIDFAEKFTLGFVEVNFPPDADLLIAALQTHPECEQIQLCILNFPDENLRFLRDEIVKELANIQVDTTKKLVLLVRGLEKSIGVFGDYPPVLQDLNFVRDAYKRTVPHPILFILPDYAITRLAKFAPDFWAWSSGVFRFKTPENTKENALNQTQNTERVDILPPPEKQERIDLLERLLMEYKPTGYSMPEGDIRRYSNVLHQLGVAYLSHRKPEKAREYLAEAEKIAENFQDSSLQIEVINSLGKTYSQQRQFETAITYYQQSLNIAQKLKNRREEATALFYLGNAYLELRQFAQTNEFYQQCLEIYQELGDRFSQASTYHNLGAVAQNLREYEEARRNYQQALAIFIEYGDRNSQASTYHELGRVAQNLWEYEEARRNYQQALAIFIEYGDRFSQASTYHQLGIVAQELREFEEARRNYQQALAIFIEYGDRFSQALTYHCLGTLAEAEENYPEARANLQTALAIYVEYKDEYWAAVAREILERLPE